jgi:SAM-dependent methyltransferase
MILNKIIRKIAKLFINIVRFIYRLTIVGLKKGPHVTRFSMYEQLSKYNKHRNNDLKVLSVSHSSKLAKLLGFNESQITDTSYPECNALRLPFDNNTFDVVISDQVLEHIEGLPEVAINEMFRVLKPNGLSLHTTCFINPVHAHPGDFWRFTPEGLKVLTEKHGEIIDVGGWGNPFIWIFVFLGLREQPIPHSKWHPANWLARYNDPKWPVVTWIMTKKIKNNS